MSPKVLLLAPMASVHEGFNTACINALLSMNADLHFAANFGMDEHTIQFGHQLQNRGYTIHDVPFVRSSLFENLRCIPILRNLFAEENFNLVHSHTETGGLLTKLSMRRDLRTKYIYTPHGMSFWKGSSLKTQIIYRPIERWICSSMVTNIAINKEEYSVLYNWNKSTARFIHGIGVNIDNFQHTIDGKNEKKQMLGIPSDSKILLSVGELNGNKNHKIVVDALSSIDIRSTKLYYLICGCDKSNGFLEEYIRRKDLTDRVILAGYRRDVDEIYAISDYFAFPSYHEGLPVSVMEAMANGLPIVASRIRGVTDLIENGKGGLLYAPSDYAGFASGIQSLLNNEDLCYQMGQLNKERVCGYDVSKVEHEMHQIYNQVLNC